MLHSQKCLDFIFLIKYNLVNILKGEIYMKKYFAEFLGTLVLVTFGCGIAVVSGCDLVATALAFGLAIVAMAYVIGNISGCHVNPAVSLAMLITKRMNVKDFIFYVIAQFLGALAGAGLLYLILSNAGYGATGSIPLGTNGFDSATAIANMGGAFITEVLLTFVFVYTILGVTADEKKSSVAGIVIGLTLTFVHLLGIKLTGTSVNPARSFGPALISGGEALAQSWVFLEAPLVGATIAALIYILLNKKEETKE
jgi:aquaporin Z